MIDWSRVNELRDEIGEDDLAEVLDMFLTEVEEKLSDLDGLAAGDPMVEAMHFLKSSALNIGFFDLAALCGQAEKAAQSGVQTIDFGGICACFFASKEMLMAGESSAAA